MPDTSSSPRLKRWGPAADAVVAARLRGPTTLAELEELSREANEAPSRASLVALAGACIALAAVSYEIEAPT